MKLIKILHIYFTDRLIIIIRTTIILISCKFNYM